MTGYTFTADSVRKIKRDHDFLRGMVRNLSVQVKPLLSRHAERGERGPLFSNDSGEVIPPFAYMEITGRTTILGVDYLTVEKPTSSLPGLGLFNGVAKIGVGGRGESQAGPVYRVLYDTGETPAAGDTYGPQSGQWYLGPADGYTVLSDADSEGTIWVKDGGQAMSRHCLALIDEASGVDGATDTSFDADNVTPVDNGYSPTASAATELTVQNPFEMSGDDNGNVEIVYDGTNWVCVQMKCPAS